MANINDFIPRLVRNPINGKIEQVNIDDAFDPLFNAKAKSYLQNKYGAPKILTPLYGYTEFLDNMFTPKDGKWSILGPSMGILGGFGRTLDKAEDFVLGGVTEGVNAVNQVNPFSTAPTVPQNPIRNIFVNDEDYTGNKLFAAMSNSMNKLAGGTVLDESDFNDTTWKPAELYTEIMTDPGVLGGVMSKAGKAPDLLKQIADSGVDSPTQKVGQLLSNYDDIVTAGAWDVTVPGLRPAIKSQINKLRQLLAVNSEKALYNVPLKDLSDKDIIDNEIFNAQKRWESAIKNSGIYDANPETMPTILDHVEKELNDFDDIMVRYQLADDEYISKVGEIRQAINDAREILNNPKLAKAPDTEKIVKNVNKILTDRGIEIADLRRTTRAGRDIQQSLKRAGIIKGNLRDTDYAEVLSEPKDKIYGDISDFNLNQDELKELVAEATDFTDEFGKPGLPEAYVDMTLTSKGMSLEGNPQKQLNAILEGDYFEDDYVSKKARDKMRKLLNVHNPGGHKVFFTTSKYYNSMSELGDTAVKRIKNTDIDFDRLIKRIEFEENNLKRIKSNAPIDKKIIDAKVAKLREFIAANDAKYGIKSTTTDKQLYDFILSQYNKPKKTFYEIPNEYKGIVTKFKNALTDDKMSNKEFLDLANTFSEYIDYIRKRYGYLGFKEESRLNEFKNLIDENVNLGLVGTGASKGKSIGSMQEIAKQYNEMLNYYKDPWIKPDGSVDLNKYFKAKTYLKNRNLADLMISSKETFDLAQVIKESPKYKVGKMSVEDIQQDLYNLYVATMTKSKYGIQPYSKTDYILNNKYVNQLQELSNMTNNPYYLKGTDALNDYQKDFIRNLSKLDTNEISNFSFKVHGTDVDPYLFTSKQKLKAIEAEKAQKVLDSMKLKDLDKAKEVLTTLDNTDFSKYVINESNLNDTTFKELLKDKVLEAGYSERHTRTLFDLINKELSEPYKFIQGNYATTRIKQVREILDNFDAISKRYGIGTEDFDMLDAKAQKKRFKEMFKHTEMYLSWKDYLNDDITHGNSFINDLFSSGGITVGVFDKNKNLAQFQAAERAIINNLTVINKQMPKDYPFINLIENEVGNGKVVLGYALETKNLNAAKEFAKLKIDESKLKDVVWSLRDEARAQEIAEAFGKEKNAKFTFEEMDNLFNQSQEISRDLSRKIGYTEFSDDYFKHAVTTNKNAEKWLSSYVYNGINTDDLADLSKTIQDVQLTSSGKAYGITPITRRLRGPISNWNNLSPGTYVFSVDPSNIVKKTFSEGIFDNSNFQTHVGLFMNDNFRISSYAENIDDLKKILQVQVDNEYTGNLDNLMLVAPRYTEEGRIVGFEQFDKLSDEGLQKALKNPETIIVPTHLIAPLDKMLRKDIKMSNKVYAFINKYLTIPVKFGTLTNLGFLIGNMGDAGFKQAATLSKKYGTSIPYEMARVAESVKNTIVLNNKFSKTFTKYSKYMEKSMGDKFIDYYKITDSLVSTPKARKNFEEWLGKALSTGEITNGDMDVCRLWLFLNNKENTSIFKGDFHNLGDLAQAKSKYAPPRNLIERLLKGDQVMINEKEVKTYYGLFAGNPITEGILEKSGTIESVARSASILNDLTRTYGSKEIYKILGDTQLYEKEFRDLNIKALDALNVMSTANFDYNYMNDLTDRFATFVPFPTFVVKNYAYWMDMMVNKPELIDSIINMQEVAWRGKDTSKDEFQAEAKGRGAIPLSTSKNSKLKGIFKPTPTQSMFSAFDVVQNPIGNLAFRTNPILTPITHHLQKPEDDKYRPYSTDPYEKNIKRGDKDYNVLRATFHRINPYERTINTWLRTPSKLFGPEHNAQISDFVPSVFQPDFSTKSKSKNKKR